LKYHQIKAWSEIFWDFRATIAIKLPWCNLHSWERSYRSVICNKLNINYQIFGKKDATVIVGPLNIRLGWTCQRQWQAQQLFTHKSSFTLSKFAALLTKVTETDIYGLHLPMHFKLATLTKSSVNASKHWQNWACKCNLNISWWYYYYLDSRVSTEKLGQFWFNYTWVWFPIDLLL
jgi:hypothetical protein